MTGTNRVSVGNAKFSDYAKKSVVGLVIAVITAVASALGIVLASMADGSDGGSIITGAEWVKFVIALLVGLAGALGTAYGVYQAANVPQPARGLVPAAGEGPVNGPAAGPDYPGRL